MRVTLKWLFNRTYLFSETIILLYASRNVYITHIYVSYIKTNRS